MAIRNNIPIVIYDYMLTLNYTCVYILKIQPDRVLIGDNVRKLMPISLMSDNIVVVYMLNV